MTAIVFHTTKNKGTVIGCERDKNAAPYEMKRSRLKPVSKKQRKRTDELDEKLKVLLTKQVELYGTTRCEAGFKLRDGKCFGVLHFDHIIPRSRHPENVDGYANGQILCTGHNGEKGSKDTDYRPEKMREACEALDLEDARPCGCVGECQDEGQEPEE